MSAILSRLNLIIGPAAAHVLVMRWAGQKIKVPAKADSNHPLALSIGVDALQKLVDEMPGEFIYLPAVRKAIIEKRNQVIAAEYEAGVSIVKIAVKYGLTRAGVKYVLKREAEMKALRRKYGP